MPGTIYNMRGARYGRLTVKANAEPVLRGGHAYWPCVCDCGAHKLVRGSKMREGRIVSCGCWRAEPAVRQGARLRTPAARRRAIAAAGARATNGRRTKR
jgi:hypothetical protein